MSEEKIVRVQKGVVYKNDWEERVLMFGFDEEDIKFFSRMTDKTIYVVENVTDLISMGARLALIKDGPRWQKDKGQLEKYLREFGARENCRFCVIDSLNF